MSLLECLILLNTLAIVLLTVYLVIMSKKLFEIGKLLSEFSEDLKEQFFPAIQQMKNVSEKIGTISNCFGDEKKEAHMLFETLEEVGGSLNNLIEKFKKDYEPLIKGLMGFWYGCKTASSIMDNGSQSPASESKLEEGSNVQQ